MNNKKNYMLFWLSQAVSELGSMMTSYALIIWVYQQSRSVMQVSLLTFFTFAPKAITSFFIGDFVDHHDKKKIIMITDTVSAICSVVICMLLYYQRMSLPYIYVINIVLGVMEAIQSPASSVAFGLVVPEDKYEKISGLSSITENVSTILYPMCASAMMGFFGIASVLMFDIATFLFAITVMFFCIVIPEGCEEEEEEGMFDGFFGGVHYLKENKGILYIIICMTLMNFLSRLSYENILSAMILARSNNSEMILGIVTSFIGAGGIVGGILVSSLKMPKNKVKMLFYSAALSFVLGDLLMAFGQNVYVWSIAGIAASLPIPFTMAAQTVLIYTNVSEDVQGRVFAVKNAMKFVAIPLGILLGGSISEYLFEPFVHSGSNFSNLLVSMLGNTEGTGMAVMFLCTGITGFVSCMLLSRSKQVKELISPDDEDEFDEEMAELAAEE